MSSFPKLFPNVLLLIFLMLTSKVIFLISLAQSCYSVLQVKSYLPRMKSPLICKGKSSSFFKTELNKFLSLVMQCKSSLTRLNPFLWTPRPMYIFHLVNLDGPSFDFCDFFFFVYSTKLLVI